MSDMRWRIRMNLTLAPGGKPALRAHCGHVGKAAVPLMRTLRVGIPLLAALVAALAAPARAAYEDLGTSARVTGMSNAFTAVADDAYSIYYNPAGLATLDRPEFATTYAQLLTGLSDNSSVQNSFFAYVHPIDG